MRKSIFRGLAAALLLPGGVIFLAAVSILLGALCAWVFVREAWQLVRSSTRDPEKPRAPGLQPSPRPENVSVPYGSRRRRSMTAIGHPSIMTHIVTLEMHGAIDFWACRSDGSIAVLLNKPVSCSHCHTMHFWFVNRDGRTRCIDCDGRAEILRLAPLAQDADASSRRQARA